MAYIRMHELPQEGEKTAKQWLKENMIVKKGHKSNERWVNECRYATAEYYKADDVREMTEKEKLAIKIEKIKQQQYKLGYKEGYKNGYDEGHEEGLHEAEMQQFETEYDLIVKAKEEAEERIKNETLKQYVYGTAREWLKRGRIVIDNTKEPIINGDEKFGENWGFFYYHILDTTSGEKEKINELLKKWYQNKVKIGEDGEIIAYKGLKWW